MSQHWFEVSSNKGRVQVMLGWDAPLKWFHMCIDPDISDTDEPYYSNLFENDPKSVTLEHLQNILDSFDIKDIEIRPATTGLYEKLLNDKANNV